MTRTTLNIPDRDDRIDLQPFNRETQLFNNDPKTGLPVGDEDIILDATGEPIQVDGEGNLQYQANYVTLRSQRTNVNYDRLRNVAEFNVSELTGGQRVGVLSTEEFGVLCEPTRDDDSDQLQTLIDQLRAEIARLNGELVDQRDLNRTIQDLRSELSDVTTDLEDLVNVVEKLQRCNESLERSLEARDSAVERLSTQNRTLSLEVARLGGSPPDLDNTGGDTGTDVDGNTISTSDLTALRDYAELFIGRLTERDKQNLSADISIVRTSVVGDDLYESFDLIISALSPVTIDALTGEIEATEIILGRPFTYVYSDRVRGGF